MSICLVSLLLHNYFEIHSDYCIYQKNHSFLLLSYILLYGWTPICLSIYLLTDIWVLSSSWLIQIQPQMNFKVRGFIQTHVFIPLGQILRSGMARSCTRYMFNVLGNWKIVWFYLSNSSVWELQVLYVLDKTWYGHYV